MPADLRGQVAGILFVGLVLSQLMAAVLYVVLLPRWQRTRSNMEGVPSSPFVKLLARALSSRLKMTAPVLRNGLRVRIELPEVSA